MSKPPGFADEVKTVVVDGPTHWLMIDRAEAVNKAIEEFLATL